MKSTSAAEVIIQALCPGPGVVVMALGAPLVMYASRSATRVARSGGVGAAAGAAGVWATAAPSPSVPTPAASTVATRRTWVRVRVLDRLISLSWRLRVGVRKGAAPKEKLENGDPPCKHDKDPRQ